ncbi:toll/interleukin-1 receptor domain-containing protein [Azonexus sp.]|uniref:toll/interleukin-1 receptor domain-containing protein n=1 Tax=Azonexus sp. TaxID=1872668 RepID=UPI0035B48DBD
MGIYTPMTPYDVFISHASEDKAEVARPLSEFLRSLGVDVWYDEFTLDMGDSLSRSIDKGLAASRFGVVILSPSFFLKGWPQHELAGLVSKEVAYGKTILPVWHKVAADDIRQVSPTLADKVAVATDALSIEQIGLRIVKVARPEIFANLQRWLLWREAIKKATPTVMPIADLKPSPIRHETLPISLLVRIRLVHAVLSDAVPMNLTEMITNFQRDANPTSEVAAWEHIACAYLIACQRAHIPSEQRRDLFAELLGFSISGIDTSETPMTSSPPPASLAYQAWLDAEAPLGT